MPINNSIINQKGTPAFFSDIFANRPAFGYAGRVFISTDTGAIYEDTGTSWTLIADAGAGTTGTLQQVTTNGNTTTLGVTIQGIDINDGAGTGTLNTAIGTAALIVNTTGTRNTAIGYNSLQANTTGFNNAAVGTSSLALNTTGQGNTAIGYASLFSSTTADNNTAIGSASLNQNTTGANNTAIGSASLSGNTTGNNNTSIGYDNLSANSTGSSNTAVGTQSLRANTTAINNTAIGFQSLYGNTTGNNNTAIGFQPLYANTTGIGNVAIGNGALGTNTTGQYNTAVGQSGLAAITTGTLNTAIGSASGNAITTGSNNTILGNYAGTTTLASNIVLSDGAGNVRLFSDANGLIGINQAVGSTIGGQLDIHSTQTYALVLNGLTTSNAYTAFSNNSVGQWRIGNTYNAGANTFDIYNLGTSSNALSFNKTTNNATFIANVTASSLIKSGGTSAQILAADGSVITAGTNITISGGTIASSGGGGSMAIGGSITSATAGSILFAGTSGVLAQNNANFFWDNTNVKFGIGTNTPVYNDIVMPYAKTATSTAAILFIRSNEALASNPFGLRFQIIGAATLSNRYASLQTTDYNSADGGNIVLQPASGNIAIGTSTIGSKLQVNGNAAIGYSASTAAPTNGLAVAGNVGVGMTAPTGASGFTTLGLNGTTAGLIEIYNNGTLRGQISGGSGNLFIEAKGSGIPLQFFTNLTNRLDIASTGVITISNLAGTGSRAVVADASGVLSAPVSDISVKQNIQTIGYGLNEILKMNPVWFDYIDEYKNFGKTRQNGNIAQEMESIIPEAVFTTHSTGKMGINYDQLHAVYIKAIQELKAEIEILKNK